ncbi:YdcH family protein [Marivibrio halodurans]|uniref:YdcH family protein n=1 Tax=Marivibrio halodurans TaxID=2039722 RepID=A0A8J7RZZ1_9PROT|nr:YdcH family protein [Marivibrio halodurans]MBP5856153.1 YdcH family protein [Marivibrio halodurans]
MSKTDRIESLKAKHAQIDEMLHREEIRPHPDESMCHKLKREKLALKDEMTRMQASP